MKATNFILAFLHIECLTWHIRVPPLTKLVYPSFCGYQAARLTLIWGESCKRMISPLSPLRYPKKWAGDGTHTQSRTCVPSAWRSSGAAVALPSPPTTTATSRTAWTTCSKRWRRSLKAGSAAPPQSKQSWPTRRYAACHSCHSSGF